MGTRDLAGGLHRDHPALKPFPARRRRGVRTIALNFSMLQASGRMASPCGDLPDA